MMSSFLILFILVVVLPFCVGHYDNHCNVLPKDQYIEVGSDASILCQSSCSPGKIFWTVNKEHVDESLSQVLNSSHAVLVLRNFTHHRAVVECHSADNLLVLGGTTIRTYTRPQQLSCIFHSENQTWQNTPELFTCSWQHHMNSSLDISYTVFCTFSPASKPTEICQSQTRTCTTNYLSHVYKHLSIEMNGSVIVRAKTAAWEAESVPYEFNPLQRLKIIPRQVNVTAFPDHLLVEWNQQRGLKLGPCQVKYRKAIAVSDETPQVVLTKSLNLIIEQVESCTEYRVSVRCALDQAPWSNWSHERKVLTKLKRSDIKLHLWRNIAQPGETGMREVHVMWKGIPSRCEGTFNYIIKQTPYKMFEVNTTSCGNLTCDIAVDQDAHTISLTVFYNEVLLADSSFYVPAIAESLPRVTNIQTSSLNGAILVTWTTVPDATGYMIHWTHDGNHYHWDERRITNTKLFDLLDKMPYNITVTPLFADKTGHGTDVFQICSRVGGPGNVTITDVQTYDRSAQVSWSIKSEEICSGAVVNYTIVYSLGSLDQKFHVTVSDMKQDAYLKNLNPDTEYRVYIQATALTGTSTSKERLFKTKRFDPRLITVLGITGGIIVILTLSLVLCYAIWWKKISQKPVPNPGLSSVALWLATGQQKVTCPLEPFSNLSESFCERVYTEEVRSPTPPPPATTEYNPNPNPDSDQTEDITDPAIVSISSSQIERQVESIDTLHSSSPGESTSLLPVETSPFNPYRSQNTIETPAPRTCKQRLIPTKQAVYVTLAMFEQRR